MIWKEMSYNKYTKNGSDIEPETWEDIPDKDDYCELEDEENEEKD